MNIKVFFLSFILPVLSGNAQTSTTLISALAEINPTPINITFQNTFEINNTHGHLQGIQSVHYGESNYWVLTGSSEAYSYFGVLKNGSNPMMVSVNKILEAPFSHAGGFQIWDNLMAIGVEDDESKSKSKVFIFLFDNPEKPHASPLAIIDRYGTSKRGTAGCVAITTVKEKVLVVVGDWDTEHLDFYSIDHDKLFEEGATLELEFTIDSRKQDKGQWIDLQWYSYQNINFIHGENDKLFLAGLGINTSGENVIDLFEVISKDYSTFALNKVYTRTFAPNDSSSFRWGAGIAYDQKGQLSIMTTGENIGERSIIQVYK